MHRGARRPAGSSGARVVEIEQALVDWMRDGTIPHGPAMLADERANRSSPTSRNAVAEAAGRSLRPGAARRRQRPGLPGAREQRGALPAAVPRARYAGCCVPGGVLVIWSADRRPELEARSGGGLRRGRGPRRTTSVCRSATSSTGSTSRGYRPPHERRNDYRIEHDSMGEVRVPADALWRAQTQRAVENFPISGTGLERRPRPRPGPDQGGGRPGQRRARGDRHGPGRGDREAAAEVVAGEHDDQFPVDVFQTGSGTSSNMNMNEVIASLATSAGADVHPNDHVNASQSTNDTFPTVDPRRRRASPSTERPAACARHPASAACRAKAEEFAGLGEVRPHPPDGRHAGDARPGVRRVRRHGPATPPSGSRRRSPGSASCRSAAPPSAPASTPRPASRPG